MEKSISDVYANGEVREISGPRNSPVLPDMGNLGLSSKKNQRGHDENRNEDRAGIEHVMTE